MSIERRNPVSAGPRPGTCTWIEGEIGAPDTFICGQPVKPGTSWCPAHCERVFIRAKTEAAGQ